MALRAQERLKFHAFRLSSSTRLLLLLLRLRFTLSDADVAVLEAHPQITDEIKEMNHPQITDEMTDESPADY